MYVANRIQREDHQSSDNLYTPPLTRSSCYQISFFFFIQIMDMDEQRLVEAHEDVTSSVSSSRYVANQAICV